MKRIGICTLYYQNRNYGANLQAYALQSVLSAMGNEALLIPYYSGTRLRRILAGIKHSLKKKDCVFDSIRDRNDAIDCFNRAIPHSKCFYANTIDNANEDFDCFITGSDQVWNPNWINRYMSLEFTEKNKLTISYAASIGLITLNEEQENKLCSALEHTKHVSVREKESIPALQKLTDKKIEYVLDPTMLLTSEEWDKICATRIVEDKYIFCYFLKGNANLRKVAKEYAKKKNLKIVTLPYLNACYRQIDEGFGDEQLYRISPKEFLSLIKYASFVLTDSFHAAVFSHIYEREFAVAGNRQSQMGCRMQSLVELFGTKGRYFQDEDLVTEEALSALDNQPLKLDYESFEKMRHHSFDFLNRVLKDD